MDFMGLEVLFDRNNGFGVRNAPPCHVCSAHKMMSPGSEG